MSLVISASLLLAFLGCSPGLQVFRWDPINTRSPQVKNFSALDFIRVRDFLLSRGKLTIWSQKYGDGHTLALSRSGTSLVFVYQNRDFWPETIFVDQNDQRLSFRIQRVGDCIYFWDSSEFYFHRELTAHEFSDLASVLLSKVLSEISTSSQP